MLFKFTLQISSQKKCLLDPIGLQQQKQVQKQVQQQVQQQVQHQVDQQRVMMEQQMLQMQAQMQAQMQSQLQNMVESFQKEQNSMASSSISPNRFNKRLRNDTSEMERQIVVEDASDDENYSKSDSMFRRLGSNIANYMVPQVGNENEAIVKK